MGRKFRYPIRAFLKEIKKDIQFGLRTFKNAEFKKKIAIFLGKVLLPL